MPTMSSFKPATVGKFTAVSDGLAVNLTQNSESVRRSDTPPRRTEVSIFQNRDYP
ncbi:hypothetical protein RBSWK_02872 [Rhodopirellula baltica SWK14]|uniref:Uncharacterized protein n=1 Tax=Rhodopirellula baltica SWK14 TaxID=993516 RepID=L7CIZ1_RHOBT|nr:hypothetical protein RBSWK_02872 [Rhodopirellula baltica SWK14]